ncbi:MAG: hypothetical protein HKL84_06750, partial [Acidimicrobiaceae bacterium]|nr:hypothetical protein [Acidimicrobiaceae bacterium]
LNLTCEFGDFDISYAPSGTTGYDDLSRAAHTILIGDVSARVADLADIIRSKRAAGRPKDIAVLPALYEYAKTLGSDASHGVDPSDPAEPTVDGHVRPGSPRFHRRRK